MKLKYFLTGFEEKLRNSIPDNLDKYNSQYSWSNEFAAGKRYEADTKIDCVLPELVFDDKNMASSDVTNAISIHRAMKHLSIQQAMDARLWAHLCHMKYWSYMQARWVSEENSVEKIKDRFFIKSSTSSRALIRNGIARLWWFGYLSFDEQNALNPYELTYVLLKNQDIQASLLERSFGKSPVISKAFLKTIKKHEMKILSEDKKSKIQNLAKFLNRLGGVTLLDCMDEATIIAQLDEYIARWEA